MSTSLRKPHDSKAHLAPGNIATQRATPADKTMRQDFKPLRYLGSIPLEQADGHPAGLSTKQAPRALQLVALDLFEFPA